MPKMNVLNYKFIYMGTYYVIVGYMNIIKVKF